MKKNDIIRGNKLIDKFHQNKEYLDLSTLDMLDKLIYTNELPYDKSWNLLMPVVEKIEKITGGLFDITIANVNIVWWYTKKIKTSSFIKRKSSWDPIGGKMYDIIIGTFTKSPEKLKATSKIEAVWLAIVKFIEWYNDRPK